MFDPICTDCTAPSVFIPSTNKGTGILAEALVVSSLAFTAVIGIIASNTVASKIEIFIGIMTYYLKIGLDLTEGVNQLRDGNHQYRQCDYENVSNI